MTHERTETLILAVIALAFAAAMYGMSTTSRAQVDRQHGASAPAATAE